MHHTLLDQHHDGPLPLSAQLDREWMRLRLRRRPLRQLSSLHSGDLRLDRWAAATLSAATDLDDVVALTARSAGRDADRLLHWLLLVGRLEPVAARIVLQRVLPLLVSAAARGGPPDGRAVRIDDTIVAGAAAIARYDATEIRHDLAPRIASTALYDAIRKPERRRATTVEVPAGCGTSFVRHDPPAELDHLVAAARLVAAGAAMGIDDEQLDLARRLARGDSTADIASARRCTDRTIRNQRARLAEQLRTRLGDGWSDWSDPLTGIEFAA